VDDFVFEDLLALEELDDVEDFDDVDEFDDRFDLLDALDFLDLLDDDFDETESESEFKALFTICESSESESSLILSILTIFETGFNFAGSAKRSR